MSFLMFFIIFKTIFWGPFQCPPMSILYFLMFKYIYMKYEIFLALVPTTSFMCFLVSSNIIYPTFPTFNVLMPFIAWKKKFFIINLTHLVFLACYFDTHIITCCHFVVHCWHFYFFVLLHFPSSLVLLWCIFDVDKAKVILKPKHRINLNFD